MNKKEIKMKKVSFLALAFVIALSLAIVAFAAADKEAIKKQVDEIVVAMDGGKKADDFKDAAKKEPYYVFIMEDSGNMLVHPSLTGKSLKTEAGPVYVELVKATPAGIWVDYVWQEKQKHTYVRKTKSGLIVGSGYSE
jgi:hypothetical protein